MLAVGDRGRQVFGLHGRAGVVEKDVLGEQIGHAREFGGLADRELDGFNTGTEVLTDPRECRVEGRVLLVHLVDEQQAWHAEAGGGIPQQFVVDRQPTHTVHDEHRDVCGAQAGERIGEEVCIAGCVDEVEADVFPLERGDTERERLVSLTLFGLTAEHRVAGLDPARPVDGAAVQQHRLGQCGLAVALVADQRDIAEWCGGSTHGVARDLSVTYESGDFLEGCPAVHRAPHERFMRVIWPDQDQTTRQNTRLQGSGGDLRLPHPVQLLETRGDADQQVLRHRVRLLGVGDARRAVAR